MTHRRARKSRRPQLVRKLELGEPRICGRAVLSAIQPRQGTFPVSMPLHDLLADSMRYPQPHSACFSPSVSTTAVRLCLSVSQVP
eukprot:21121-Eustigmatos_ZCMA.PRE.1